MKSTMALKPLVFALAAVMAMAAQAGGRGDDHDHGHQPKGPTLEELLQIGAGASAVSVDTQSSTTNVVNNQGTQNASSITNSMNGSSGNMNGNSAAGDGNEQANLAAIASSDESFIFGTSTAAASATQYNNNNYVNNMSVTNTSAISGAGNGSSGNITGNSAAGNFNQQKNDLAIASSGGRVAQAASSASQTSSNLVVENQGTATYGKETLNGTFNAGGVFVAAGVAKTEGDDHGHGGYGDRGGKGDKDSTSKFVAVGAVELAGTTTQQVMYQNGWKNPVTNTSYLSNVGNGSSGNMGFNSAAGVGNQQVNAISISSAGH
ncbi:MULTISPECIES: heme utilization protein [unclassified Pseudomonas]|uniref:heme utilization protein n=1 Tax=unclassified Pseudomonas TaxID=196821 RepID=UPI00200CA270|nr:MULTISPECIES: heme utilization protein [unclassified Pseudomonas]